MKTKCNRLQDIDLLERAVEQGGLIVHRNGAAQQEAVDEWRPMHVEDMQRAVRVLPELYAAISQKRRPVFVAEAR